MVGRVVHLQRRLFNVDDRRIEDVATSPGYVCAASISPFQITGAQKLRSPDLGRPVRVAAWNALTWVAAVVEPAVGRQN
jgi:hypothetical protein